MQLSAANVKRILSRINCSDMVNSNAFLIKAVTILPEYDSTYVRVHSYRYLRDYEYDLLSSYQSALRFCYYSGLYPLYHHSYNIDY